MPKAPSEFTKAKGRPNGLHGWCRECQRVARAARYVVNREALCAATRAWYAANAERERAKARERARVQPPEIRQRAAARRRAAVGDVAWVEREQARSRSWRAVEENRERKRAHNTARRALRLGCRVEPYERLAIFERDGWVCQLCGTAIDPSLPWPDRMSASIDHVVPLVRGGADAPDNVQAAHLTCNCSKRHRERLAIA